jgi:hypothetical protein
MRCFFLKSGHIVGVELLPGLSDQEAVEQSHKLFAQAPEGRFDGFEVWELTRLVSRHEAPREPLGKPNGSGRQEKRAYNGQAAEISNGPATRP